jgi:hypothetical protein
MSIVQPPVPEQDPDQPVKCELASGVAVSVTNVPCENIAVHAAGQVTPAGELETVPVPPPDITTLNWCWAAATVTPIVAVLLSACPSLALNVN